MIKYILILCYLFSVMTVKGKTFETDRFTTKDGGKLEITFIKHASLLLKYEGHVIAVDPVSDYADYSLLPKADVILITHQHQDHLDLKAIGNLEKENTLIIANAASQKIIGKGIVMENGDTKEPLPYLKIQAVPAYNTTPGRDIFHPRGRDNGYILTLGGTRIYLAGDTEDIPELKDIRQIDIAFLPVNQPYTMTIGQAAKAAEVISPHIFYPYHYGETPVEELKTRLQKHPEIEVRIRALQ